MAYTNVWSNSTPLGSAAANTIDNIFRAVKVDITERFQDIFGDMPNFTADPLRPYGLKFTDAQDAILYLGDNAGTPRSILIKDKTATTTYATHRYTGITLSPPALTGSSVPFLSVSQTWNNAATTFVGMLVNVTSTASGANSLFFDYQLAGVSQWKVSKAGVGTLIGVLTAGGFSGPLTGNVTGNLTGNVTGNVTGNLTGNVTGNADTATLAAASTILATTRTIWGQNFNGSANVSGTITGVTDITSSGIITGLNFVATTGTITASTPFISATQTWNNAAVAFNGLFVNITDTASLASTTAVMGSTLAQWQVGGVNKFILTKAGAVFTAGTDALVASLSSSNIVGTTFSSRNIRVYSEAANAILGLFNIGTSFASPSALASGVAIGVVSFGGSHSTTALASSTTQISIIQAKTTEAWTTSAHGSKLEFYIVPNTTIVSTLSLTLGQDLTAAFVGAVSGAGFTSSNGLTVSSGTSALQALTATTIAGSGDFAINTNKFTVASASGNTVVAGTLNVTGAITGALTGNASTATALQTARTINGVSFDGTANITVSAGTVGTLTFGTYLQAANTTFGGSDATIATNATANATASTLVARDSSGNSTFSNVIITATGKLNIDGSAAGDTYIYESSANTLGVVVGGVSIASATATTFNTPLILKVGGSSGGYFRVDSFSAGTTYAVIAGAPANSYGAIGYNAVPTASNNAWNYGNSDFASIIQFDSGGFLFKTTTSGTAAAGITFTTRAAITQGGNFAIGSGTKFYLDGIAASGDTYISENSANSLQITAGGVNTVRHFSTLIDNLVDISVRATFKVYLDGGTDTYILEDSANVIGLVAGTTNALFIRAASIAIPATNKIFFDGVTAAGNTYVYESSADVVDFFCGGQLALRLVNNNIYTNLVHFPGVTAGSPVDGDLWVNLAGDLLFQKGGVTKTVVLV